MFRPTSDVSINLPCIFVVQSASCGTEKMERNMLNITLRDKKRNYWIRSQTKVYDIIKSVRLKKWTQEGHLARRNANRWTLRLTIWRPWLGKEAKADNV